MLAAVRKFLVAAMGNGGIVAELSLIDNNQARFTVAIITAIATALGVYAVPNN